MRIELEPNCDELHKQCSLFRLILPFHPGSAVLLHFAPHSQTVRASSTTTELCDAPTARSPVGASQVARGRNRQDCSVDDFLPSILRLCSFPERRDVQKRTPFVDFTSTKSTPPPCPSKTCPTLELNSIASEIGLAEHALPTLQSNANSSRLRESQVLGPRKPGSEENPLALR
jgi:hypothetical protein